MEAATHRDHPIAWSSNATTDRLPLSVVAKRSMDQDDVRAVATDRDRQSLLALGAARWKAGARGSRPRRPGCLLRRRIRSGSPA